MKSRFLAIVALAVVGTSLVAVRPLIAQAKGDTTFTHTFKQASADEVLNWMGTQGIQIQVDRSQLPSGRMTFAFQGLDRDTLVKSFGQMVGMNAEKRGNVYSLMRGVGGDGPAEYLGGEERGVCTEPMWDQERELQEFQFAPMEDFVFEFAPQDPKNLVEEVMKTLEESGVKMTDAQKKSVREKLAAKMEKLHASPFMVMPEGEGFKFFTGPEGGMKFWGPDQEKAMKEHAEVMKELEKSGKFKMFQGDEMMKSAQDSIRAAIERLQAAREQKNLNDEQRGAIDQALKELKKALEQKSFHLMPGGMEGLEFFHGDEYKKSMEELHKHMLDLEKEGMFKRFNDEDWKKHLEEMQKGLGENMKILQLKMENVKKFVASLTPAQKELAKKQGFLKLSDLTKAQRELLGFDENESVEMTFQIDGEKITIKNKGKESAPERKGVITA